MRFILASMISLAFTVGCAPAQTSTTPSNGRTSALGNGDPNGKGDDYGTTDPNDPNAQTGDDGYGDPDVGPTPVSDNGPACSWGNFHASDPGGALIAGAYGDLLLRVELNWPGAAVSNTPNVTSYDGQCVMSFAVFTSVYGNHLCYYDTMGTFVACEQISAGQNGWGSMGSTGSGKT